jgi:dipeptidyl aminopeptidase/acylaminoacyl peptidase
MHGTEDPIVPPAQSERFADALAAGKLPHAHLRFTGEGHGFRRAESIVTALESELAFYGQTLGFTPTGIKPIQLS